MSVKRIEAADRSGSTSLPRLLRVAEVLRTLLPAVASDSDRAVRALEVAARKAKKILVFGNGGSAADASHFAAEIVGRFGCERPPLPAVAWGSDPAITTSIANDFGYEHAIERWILALGVRGDVAIGISTSGRSPNVVAALIAARKRGLVTIALTGRAPNACLHKAAIGVAVPHPSTQRVQEIHHLLLHDWAEAIDRAGAGAARRPASRRPAARR